MATTWMRVLARIAVMGSGVLVGCAGSQHTAGFWNGVAGLTDAAVAARSAISDDGSYDVRIAVVDIGTGSIQFTPRPPGRSFEYLACVDQESRGFSAVQENEDAEAVTLRTYGLDGTLIREQEVPASLSGGYLLPAFTFSLSPSGGRLACHDRFGYMPDDLRNSLWLLDVGNRTSKCLIPRALTPAGDDLGLQWKSECELIVSFPKAGLPYPSSILSLKVPEGDLRVLYRAPGSSRLEPREVALSRDRRYAAFVESTETEAVPLNQLKILDLSTGQDSLVASGRTYLRAPCWNGDGTRIGYVEGHQTVVIFSLQDKQSEIVRTFPESIVSDLSFVSEGQLVCRLDEVERGALDVAVVIDLATRAVRTLAKDIRGSLLPIEGSGKVICMVKVRRHEVPAARNKNGKHGDATEWH